MNDVVLTQDLSSGRVHKRYRMSGGQLASYEGCNLDDAGDYGFVTLDGDGISPVIGAARIPFDLCGNCFQAEDDPTVGHEPVTT